MCSEGANKMDYFSHLVEKLGKKAIQAVNWKAEKWKGEMTETEKDKEEHKLWSKWNGLHDTEKEGHEL